MTREEQRAANRARFPELAAITDKYPHMKLVWAKDANGEIGKEPPPFEGVEIDFLLLADYRRDFGHKTVKVTR